MGKRSGPFSVRREHAVFVYANAGVFVDGYILSSIGLALVTLTPQFRLDAVSTGWIGAATLLGIFAGAPLFGRLTDRHGRRILMIADLCAFVVLALAQLFVTATWELIALRFLMGVAIGADYPIAAALVTEFWPERRRGAALCAIETVWFVGAAVAYVAGYALLATGPHSWKWILASPAIFAIAGLAMRATAPESPMWLAARDAGEVAHASFATLWQPKFRGALAFVSAMWLLQVVPLFAIYTYAPAVLTALGLGSQSSPAGSVAITTAFALGSLLSLPLVERWGRRPLCIAGFAVGIPAFALLPFVGTAGVVLCFLSYAIAIGAASGLEIVYPNELFPTQVRGTATGFAAAVSRIGAFAGTFGLPAAIAKAGTTPIMFGACLLSLLGFAISWLWAPETKGRPIA
ncbi:MAG: MFS transporter [Candidatus Eremiobacteraeota bacterium]|nr:MFS transporter [Candidatus Eremiobacteraeota bacterium]MBV8723121.1 MFS transporter [Candidatus Eremiobacteraeota bacterium]